jgi:PAS domain S-box-containing protein
MAELRRENAYLTRRLKEFGRIEHDLSTARHLLDQSSRRFERMDVFMRRGVRADTREELARIACESMVDILECEVSLVVCLHCHPGQATLSLSPGYEIGPGEREALIEWARQRVESEPPALPSPLPGSLGYRDWLCQEARDEHGQLQALLIVANTHGAKAGLHDPLDGAASHTLAAFAGQLGALVANRRGHDTLREQLLTLQSSEEMLNLAGISSNVAFWDWDLSSNRVRYSEQYVRQLGHTPDEVTSDFSEWQSRLHPKDLDPALETVRRLRRSKRDTFEAVFRLRHKSGRWIWISSKGFALRDDQGRTNRIIATHTDITVFKKLEDKLRRAIAAADRANQAKSGFLAKVSHELRTPLNGMLGSLQLLKTTPLNEEQRGLLDLGYSSGRWMLSIIGDGLDLARIEAGKLELVMTAFDPGRLVSELLVFQNASALAKGLELTVKIDRSVPARIHGDAAAIRQVTANLVGNALKFTDRGMVTVSLEAQPAATAGRVQLILTVEDTGIGIPKKFASQIFQPFQQADPDDSRRAGGIGLGLAVTRELVSLMGGTIRHQSNASKGTRFTVVLPVEALPAGAASKPEVDGAAPRFAGRILVVDDDPVSRELTALMLRRMGLQVESAINGAEGLRMLLEGGFDLAFVDCWMPVMNGLEMTRRVRAEAGGGGRIPIIALTANAQQSDIGACREAGMDDCVVKPFLTESLRDCLLAHL